MARFIFDLSDEQRALLETKRAQLGLRSMADVLRGWIDLSEDDPNDAQWSQREAATIKSRQTATPAPFVPNRIGPSLPIGNIKKPMQKTPKR